MDDAPGPVDSGSSPPAEGAISELRDLLLTPERTRVSELEKKLDDPGFQAANVSRILPQAVRLRPPGDRELEEALRPGIESVIHSSVRKNPRVLVAALAPVIGPSIRKAIADSLRAMVQSLNQAVEHSLTPRGLGWRLEAWRTGRPFAEIVLLRTLVFRVEQVFLIHRETGALLLHETAESVPQQHPEVISGMLSAIQDFVRDSFGGDDSQPLEEMQAGELSVWIERNSEAVLAAVIRGNAPIALRSTLEATLDQVLRSRQSAFDAFDGDPEPFEPSRPQLEACLLSQSRQDQRRPAPIKAWLALGAAAALAAVAFFIAWDRHARWQDALGALRAEPGVAVLHAQSSLVGTRTLEGLRDPLARDPVELLQQSGVNAESVSARWRPYYSLEPEIVLRRIRQRLQPPSSLSLQLRGEELSIAGEAPREWILSARAQAPMIPGVAQIDETELIDAGLREIEDLVSEIEGFTIYFEPGRWRIEDGQRQNLAALARRVSRLIELAQESGRRARIEVAGHTDSSGSEAFNARLGLLRAEYLAQALESQGVPRQALLSKGADLKPTTAPDPPARDQRLDRRISLNVLLEPIS